MSSAKYLAEPQPAPSLNIPESSSTVSVSIIDSTTWIEMPIRPFFEPDFPGKTHLTCPAYSFLITHRPSNRKILFDLGVRKDWTNMAPRIVNRIQTAGWSVTVRQNVADILTAQNLSLADIEAIVWSHQHWDHVGDPSTFPPSTRLVVGPGFKKAYTPGYPTNPESGIRDSDLEGREMHEISFSPEASGSLKLGRFNAHDYFGDGSFYLLDTPGHTIGHLCGLARTTANPSTFVLMAGDACHLGGEFRPSRYSPLPASLAHAQLSPKGASGLCGAGGGTCPGALFQTIHSEGKPECAVKPFFRPTDVISHDVKEAEWTIAGLQEFDANEQVLVVLAHDEQLMGVVEFFPQTVDVWRERDYAGKARWRFLGDFEEAVKKKKVEGEQQL